MMALARRCPGSYTFLLLVRACLVQAQYLPSYPLAVRSPYLSTWLPGNFAHDTPTAVAQFWQGQNLTLYVLARVDDTAYVLFGAPNGVPGAQSALQKGIDYTSTHTTVSLTAGDVDFVLDFFSPVDPRDNIRQSLPYSYLTVSPTSSTKQPDISILTAIDGTWVGPRQDQIASSYNTSGATTVFTLSNKTKVPYVENNEQASWGSVVFASAPPSNSSKSTSAIGDASSVLSDFVERGSLSSQHPAYAEGSLVAHAHHVGNVSHAASVTYAFGHYREQAVNYLNKSTQTGYFRSMYKDIDSSVTHFLSDYAAALRSSQAFDDSVRSKATSVSSSYSDILEACPRQIFGALELTIPADTLDTNDAQVFLKEISSDGNVNTIDVIYPTFPFLYALAPQYIRLLLKPVLDYLATGQWPLPYPVHDIGAHYPQAIGHNDGVAEVLPVIQTGSLLTLVYAYQKATGDTTWAKGYQPLLKGYADYLVSNGLYTESQRTTVDAIPASPNQTDLAIQSAVGLTAYGALFDAANYTQVGKSFAHVIYDEGAGLDPTKSHFTYNLHNNTGWGVMFSLYPDVLLGLNTFDATVNELESDFLATVQEPFGLRYASFVPWTILEWAMWESAISSKAVQDDVINEEHRALLNGQNNVPFPTKLLTSLEGNAAFINNKARSTIGANFALFALMGVT